MCVCVCVCVREGEREWRGGGGGGREIIVLRNTCTHVVCISVTSFVADTNLIDT